MNKKALTDRFRVTSKHMSAISAELARADRKLGQAGNGLEFLFSKLMKIRVEEAEPLRENFDTLRDQLAAALITQTAVRDKMVALFGKVEAMIGHGFEASELFVEARHQISQTMTDMVKLRGDHDSTATVMTSLLEDEACQKLLASDPAASSRILELIGPERVAAWLTKTDERPPA